MTAVDDLIAAGGRLARRCLMLGEGNGEIAAYWGGERSDDPDILPAEATALRSRAHLLTIDAALLSELGIDAPAGNLGLHLFESWSGDVDARLHWSAATVSDLTCSGEALSATPGPSFPPFEALCLHGDESVEAWLRSLGLERHQYDLAAGEPAAGGYVDHYLSCSPFHAGAADAILGGWHIRWPDDDFYTPLEMRLMLVTLRDAEPFWEAWSAVGGNFSTRERIT